VTDDDDLMDWLSEGSLGEEQDPWLLRTWLFLAGLVGIAAGLFAPLPIWGTLLVLLGAGGLLGIWGWCLWRGHRVERKK